VRFEWLRRLAPWALLIGVQLPIGAAGASLKLAGAEAGVPFEQRIALPDVPEGATYAVASGALPPGLGLEPDGTLLGIPLLPGKWRFEVAAAWDAGRTAAVVKLKVAKPLEIPTTELKPGRAGKAYKGKLKVRRGAKPYLWEAERELPPGLVLDPARGRLSGVPARPGAFPVELRVTDALGGVQSFESVLEIAADDDVRFGFAPATRYDQAGTFGGSVAIGDVDVDGRHDVVFVPQVNSPSTFLVYRQTEAGELGSPEEVATDVYLRGLALGDVDGDDDTDVVVTGISKSALSGYLGRVLVFRSEPGAAMLASPEEVIVSSNNVGAVRVGDVDSDGRSDVVVAAEWVVGPGEGRLSVFRQQADGDLGSEETYDDFPVHPQGWIRIADMDGDGDADIVLRSGMLEFAVALQDDSVSPGIVAADLAFHSVPTTYWPSFASLEVADVDGDGRNDVVTLDPGNPGYLAFFLQGPTGDLAAPALLRPWAGMPS